MARKGGKDRGLFELSERCASCGGSGCGKCEGGKMRTGRWGIRYAGSDGRIHQEIVGAKRDAHRLYLQRKADAQAGRAAPTARRRVTVAAAIDAFRRGAGAGKRSWKDDRNYEQLWIKALGTRALDEVSPSDVEHWMNEWLRARSKNSVRNRLSFLRRVFNVAIRDGLAERNPVSRVVLPKDDSRPLRFLSDAEETALRVAFSPRWWPVVQFALATGMRMSEQFRLRWEFVDLANRVATVPRSKHGERRQVPLNDDAIAVLEWARRLHDGPWVFTNTRGGRLKGQGFYQRYFLPALERAGLAGIPDELGVRARKRHGITWHTLRHTFGSRMAMEGVPLYTLQTIMGHKTIQMTQRYAHLSAGHQLEAVNRIAGRGVRALLEVTPAWWNRFNVAPVLHHQANPRPRRRPRNGGALATA